MQSAATDGDSFFRPDIRAYERADDVCRLRVVARHIGHIATLCNLPADSASIDRSANSSKHGFHRGGFINAVTT